MIQRSLVGRTALVTGATGFIGSHVVRGLIAAGCRVSVLVRPESRLDRLHDVLDALEIVYGDLASASSMAAIDASCAGDLVVHLAAAGVGQQTVDERTLLDVNVGGTLHVLELARRGNATRLIHAGSCFEYGFGSRLREDAPLAPTAPYAISKAASWMLAHTYDQLSSVLAVTLRLFTPFGPFEDSRRLIAHTILCALQGRDVALTSGEQTRDFVFVGDVVEAFLCAAAAPRIEGETINVCTGRETRVIDLVRMTLHLMGDPVKPLPGAMPSRAHEAWRMSGDARKARELLGWEARTPLEEGLRQTIQWFSEHQDQRLVGSGVQAT